MPAIRKVGERRNRRIALKDVRYVNASYVLNALGIAPAVHELPCAVLVVRDEGHRPVIKHHLAGAEHERIVRLERHRLATLTRRQHDPKSNDDATKKLKPDETQRLAGGTKIGIHVLTARHGRHHVACERADAAGGRLCRPGGQTAVTSAQP